MNTTTRVHVTKAVIGTRHIHHPDVGFQLNLPRISEFRNCPYDIKAFSLDILTRSNTLKLFPFLLFLPEVFFTVFE